MIKCQIEKIAKLFDIFLIQHYSASMKKIIIVTLIKIIVLVYFIVFQPIGICEDNNQELFYVGGIGQGNFSHIQDAINASSNGDTIFIYNGCYHENIIINKSIDIIGENRNNTIIDGKNNFEIIKINSKNINITNLKIQNSSNCGILIENSINCNIYLNIIDNNLIGINIVSSKNINIFYNIIANSTNIGVEILEYTDLNNLTICSENNTFYYNNFINNSKHAYDQCENNWFYNKEGNYWDTYTGLDKNNDGIGDIPFKIFDGNNSDKYPLMIPYFGIIRYKEFYVDENSLYFMLLISIIIAIIFVIPIAIYWRKKNLSK